MIGLMRQVRTIWWDGMFRSWLPPSEEITLSFRAVPWELDGQGRLKSRSALRILDLACRKWLTQSGLLVSAGSGRASPRVTVAGIDAVLRAWLRVEVVTRFCALSDGSGYLEHSFRITEFGVVASVRSQLENVHRAAAIPV